MDPRATPEGRRNIKRAYLGCSAILLYQAAGVAVGLYFNPTFFGALVGYCVACLPIAIVMPVYWIVRGMRGDKL